jgi:hypothetical protein
MKKRALLTITVASAALLATAGIALGTSLAGYTLRSTLDAKNQVPAQVVKAPKAKATFTGTLTRLKDGRGKLTWTLNYSDLSSTATKGLLFIPKSAKLPATAVQFCAGCKSHASGVVMPLPARVASALETRTGWVSIRTKRNPKGEIRGRLVVK